MGRELWSTKCWMGGCSSLFVIGFESDTLQPKAAVLNRFCFRTRFLCRTLSDDWWSNMEIKLFSKIWSIQKLTFTFNNLLIIGFYKCFSLMACLFFLCGFGLWYLMKSQMSCILSMLAFSYWTHYEFDWIYVHFNNKRKCFALCLTLK